MQKIKRLVAGLLIFAPSAAFASPYFRFIDPAHPQPVVGAGINPAKLGDSRAVTLLPLFTHSTRDGCLLPAVVCEDWTPLAVGASLNAGRLTFDVAPLANVLPWVQRGLDAALPASWSSTRAVLVPVPGNPVTFAAGPMWEYRQLENKGYFLVVTALALHF